VSAARTAAAGVPLAERPRLAAEAARTAEFLVTLVGGDPAAACLYYALAAAEALAARGERPVLQAGTHLWRCVASADDDGVSPTHVGYVWDPSDAASAAALELGLMPEMHVWVALPDRREVVDLTTRHLPERARRLGLRWTEPQPPDYLWAGVADLPDGARLLPDGRAVAWVLRNMERAGADRARVLSWGLPP
jgi:hypothetical protein